MESPPKIIAFHTVWHRNSHTADFFWGSVTLYRFSLLNHHQLHARTHTTFQSDHIKPQRLVFFSMEGKGWERKAEDGCAHSEQNIEHMSSCTIFGLYLPLFEGSESFKHPDLPNRPTKEGRQTFTSPKCPRAVCLTLR